MYHFNAFISYKHADLDNKVAESIIRDLERYRIPRKIRKSTGIKKIDRVFRDKDELPITSDLNDTISQALINSDFLIVICSTNTKKSTWVDREIEFFLQHHSINNVMTVLADGEPYDVIPKILLSGKKEVIDENGEKKIVEIPYEPLSCDYRMPYKKAKAKELPRLVAAIIGCPYDELIDRQRQYKMQRMTAISAGMIALSLGFAGYMYYSNTLIHENYLESLRNQSRYLANESLKQLDDYNRMDAIQLALEALPENENDERPVTPEAKKALTDSLLAYKSCQGLSVSALWNYRMPNSIDDFWVSEDRSKLVIMDVTGIVAAYDTKTHKELLKITDYDDTSMTADFFDDNTLVVLNTRSIAAYNLEDGSCIWTNAEDDVKFCQCLYKFSDDEILIINSDGEFVELSIKDGSVIKKHPVEEMLEEKIKASEDFDEENDYVYVSIGETALSENGKKMAFVVSTSIGSSNTIDSLNEYDFETGTIVSVPIENEKVALIKYFGDNIFLSCNPVDMDGNSRFFDYVYITDSINVIRCLASGDLSIKWEDQVINTDVTINYDFLPMSNGTIGYYEGCAVKIWNKDTGEVVVERRFNDSIIDSSDWDGDGNPLYVTHGGYTGTIATGKNINGVNLIKRFTDEIEKINYGANTYVRCYRSNEIICYGMEVYDNDWTKIETSEPIDMSSSSEYLEDNTLAILSTDGSEGTVVYIFDAKSQSYTGKVTIDKEKKPFNFEIVGSLEGKLYIASDSDSELRLIEINTSNLEFTEDIIDDDYDFYDVLCALGEDKLLYCTKPSYDSCNLIIRNLSTKSEEEIEIPSDYYTNLIYDSKTNTGFICGKSNVIFDLSSNTVNAVEFDDRWESSEMACISSDGETFAVTDKNNIKLLNKKGEILADISCRNVTPLGLSFFKNGNAEEILLVAYGDGALLRYSASNGKLLGTTDLSVYGDDYYDTTIYHTECNKYAYVKTGHAIDVIDTDVWFEETCVTGCLGYHEGTDKFFTYSYNNVSAESYIGYFEHYSVNDLIEKAKKELNGLELSDEKKSMYGIAD